MWMVDTSSSAVSYSNDNSSTNHSSIPPNMTLCPHCHQGYGSSSIDIHIKRCRQLILNEQESDKKNIPLKKKIRNPLSLRKICLGYIINHLEATCINQMYSQPSYQASLFSSLPSDLSQQLFMYFITQLKSSKKKIEEKNVKTSHFNQLDIKYRQLSKHLELIQSEKNHLRQLLYEARNDNKVKDKKIFELKKEMYQLKKEISYGNKNHSTRNKTINKSASKNETRCTSNNNNNNNNNNKLIIITHCKRLNKCKIPLPNNLSREYLSILQENEQMNNYK